MQYVAITQPRKTTKKETPGRQGYDNIVIGIFSSLDGESWRQIREKKILFCQKGVICHKLAAKLHKCMFEYVLRSQYFPDLAYGDHCLFANYQRMLQ